MPRVSFTAPYDYDVPNTRSTRAYPAGWEGVVSQACADAAIAKGAAVLIVLEPAPEAQASPRTPVAAPEPSEPAPAPEPAPEPPLAAAEAVLPAFVADPVPAPAVEPIDAVFEPVPQPDAAPAAE